MNQFSVAGKGWGLRAEPDCWALKLFPFEQCLEGS